MVIDGIYYALALTAGGTVALNTIAITGDPSSATALWRIGNWDGTPAELRNGDKVTTMHPSDVRMSAWAPGTFVVGSSSATAFPACQWKDVNGTQTITFNLTAAQVADHTVRVGITTAYAGGRPKLGVNAWTSANPSASTQTVLIDFIELEALPAALPLPEHALSFTDYSPAGDGVTDDTQKLQQALADAAQQKRTLFVPAGKYRINSVQLGEGTLQGAGMWHTRFVGPRAQLHFTGGTATVSDLSIFGETTHRNDKSDVGNAFTGRPGDGTTIARVWVEHMKCAFWVDRAAEAQGPTQLRITECRFRDLMADAVNFCNGTTNSMVDNTEIRNSGDDSLASWSPRHGGPPSGHNTFAYNVISSPWVANGIALYGGGPFRVIGNTVSDTVTTGSGIYVSASFDSHAFQGLIEVSDNALIRAGAHESDMGGPTGALRVLAAEGDMTGAQFLFRNNTVTDPLESALSIQGPHPITGLQVDGLQVVGAPLLVDVRPGARGEAALSHVTAKGASASAVRGADTGLFKLIR